MAHPRPCQPSPTVTATCDNIPNDSYEKDYSGGWVSIQPVGKLLLLAWRTFQQGVWRPDGKEKEDN